jgi:hypothetical protein
MIAALICVISIAAFLQFFVSHCRSILASSRNVELSDRVREVTGVEGSSVSADDFHRLLQLVKLCPEQSDDQVDIRAVGTYYSILRLLAATSSNLLPGASAWAERECRNCSHFAAVALDRRISHSRDLLIQQAVERP